jgi:hypothetical protein
MKTCRSFAGKPRRKESTANESNGNADYQFLIANIFIEHLVLPAAVLCPRIRSWQEAGSTPERGKNYIHAC